MLSRLLTGAVLKKALSAPDRAQGWQGRQVARVTGRKKRANLGGRGSKIVGVARCGEKKCACTFAVSRTLDVTIPMLTHCCLTKLVLEYRTKVQVIFAFKAFVLQ